MQSQLVATRMKKNEAISAHDSAMCVCVSARQSMRRWNECNVGSFYIVPLLTATGKD